MKTLSEIRDEHAKAYVKIKQIAEGGDLEEARRLVLIQHGKIKDDLSSTAWIKSEIESATTAKKLLDKLDTVHIRTRNDMKSDLIEHNRLARIVDLISGDSWNGTHSRGMSVAFDGDDTITVINESYDSDHKVTETFTVAEFAVLASEDVVQHTYYGSDFLSALDGQTALAEVHRQVSNAWKGIASPGIGELIAAADSAEKLTAEVPGAECSLISMAAALGRFSEFSVAALRQVNTDQLVDDGYCGRSALEWLARQDRLGELIRPEIWQGRTGELRHLFTEYLEDDSKDKIGETVTKIIEAEKMTTLRTRSFPKLAPRKP